MTAMGAADEVSAPTWHALDAEDVRARLEVDPDQGLGEDEVEARRREHGENGMARVATRSGWRILLGQFRTIPIQLLAAAAVLAFATGRLAEGLAVVAVIVVNTAIGFVSEWRAVRSMAALRSLGEHRARVVRGGRERTVGAVDLVPGDVTLVTEGELVPADLRLMDGDHLRVNEASLTGESVPADKLPSPVDREAELAEQSCMLFEGTSVVDGSARGVVVATGRHTALGRISELAQRAESGAPPLQERLDRLGRRLAWVVIAVAVVVGALGLAVRGQDAELVIETALALGIAAIPEALPIVATIALARGMWVMARRNALIERLTAVETLGATRVVFTDKTGTLTENRVRLTRVGTAAGDVQFDEGTAGDGPSGHAEEVDALARRVVELGVLCNGASLDDGSDEDSGRGDPTEIALLEGGRALGFERAALLDERPERRVRRFDPEVAMMATFHAAHGGFTVAVKGAPEAVLEVADREATEDGEQPLDDAARDLWRERADELADQGLRLLAMAEKQVDSERADPYTELCWVGLVGLLDPPLEHVEEAIDACQAAGIRVEMLTGDQPRTALAIARAVGIVGGEGDPETSVMRGREIGPLEEADEDHRGRIHRANIFARVSPEQKLDLVRIYQDHGEIVAMTGDGVNDAPALQQADIGVAMGRRGTDAAKQVADMVLRDDSFESIVAAVSEGRVIFSNIRKAVMFLVCTNVAEVLAVSIATLAGWPLPLRPLQILYLNVLTDVFPALALGVGPATGDEMRESPRDPQEAVLTRGHWLAVTGWSTLIAACVLGSLLYARHGLGLEVPAAVTVSFLTIAFGKLWFVFVLRSPRQGFFDSAVVRNGWIWASIGLCTALLVAAVYLPGLSALLETRDPGPRGIGLMLGASLVPVLVGQVVLAVRRGRLAANDAAD